MWNRFIDESSEEHASVGGKLSFVEELDDEEMLNNYRESLGLPACESVVLNKWFAYVYQVKNKSHLFIGKLIERFLLMKMVQ